MVSKVLRGRPSAPRWLAVACLPFLVLWVAVAFDHWWVVSLDGTVARELHEAVRRSPDRVDRLQAVAFLGTSVVLYSVVAVVAAVALAARRLRLAVFVVVTAVTGGILNHLVKDAVGRARPSFPDPVAVGGGPSFPSGHAMNSAIVFGAAVVALAALTRRWWGPFLVATVLVLAIGFTRVALGVHYLSDVIGGWSLGLVWIILGSLTIVGRAEPDPGGAPGSAGAPPVSDRRSLEQWPDGPVRRG